jgi:hypothetical protein
MRVALSDAQQRAIFEAYRGECCTTPAAVLGSCGAWALDEAVRLMEQNEPAGSSTMYGHLRRVLSIPRQLVWIDGPLRHKPACDAALADSLRAFDTMTIDDLAALQTAR